jgi:hypothetical protein
MRPNRRLNRTCAEASSFFWSVLVMLAVCATSVMR